jgi:hypothetical protein
MHIYFGPPRSSRGQLGRPRPAALPARTDAASPPHHRPSGLRSACASARKVAAGPLHPSPPSLFLLPCALFGGGHGSSPVSGSRFRLGSCQIRARGHQIFFRSLWICALVVSSRLRAAVMSMHDSDGCGAGRRAAHPWRRAWRTCGRGLPLQRRPVLVAGRGLAAPAAGCGHHAPGRCRWAARLTVMVLVYSVGHIFGSHLNAAVSIAIATCDRFP